MAPRHSPVRWVLILLVVGLVGIGAAAAARWPLQFPLQLAHSKSSTQRATATVLTSVPCGPPDARDEVAVRWADRTQKAQLDGCGHREGEVLEVEVPVNPPENGLIVRIAGTSATSSGVLRRRISEVLFVLSALSGAIYAYLIRAKPTRVTYPLRRLDVDADGRRVRMDSHATGSRSR